MAAHMAPSVAFGHSASCSQGIQSIVIHLACRISRFIHLCSLSNPPLAQGVSLVLFTLTLYNQYNSFLVWTSNVRKPQAHTRSITMKFIIPGFVLALATSVAASDQATCLHNHPNIWVAITELCSRGDLVVPSNYLSKGMWHGGRYVSRVSLDQLPAATLTHSFPGIDRRSLHAFAIRTAQVLHFAVVSATEVWLVFGAES